ncbi:ABC transporter ATP-binding protein [Rhodoferax koreense]|uniref:ABC transporter ATP-binding protein n=1 Tax=Rhodoferax koreensis TaxID=1842727 RepID=A0A1P8JXR0_9BURK|nr:VWA domain-containing protein [Rhodoferax koreense]APW38554.1 ABC transporter ATP-binding protein [Rhodoferax koreense]
MSFLWPQTLWLLFALPLLVLAYVWLLRRRKVRTLRFSNLSTVRQAMGGGIHWRRHLPPALLLMSMAALVLAASRPMARIALPSDHATIMLAIDVSLSMRANDVKPNRMVAAQEAAKAFLQELPKNVRVGIVTFAGSAQLVQPATLNREDLVAAIDKFQMQTGTAVGSGIVASLAELFPEEGIDLGEMTFGERRQRGKPLDATGKADQPPKKEVAPVAPGSYTSAAIILLTDGRRTTGVDTQQAAKMAADHGVKVYAVGLGTVDGEVASSEGWSMYLRLDEPSLKAVAATTQGEYFYAGTAENLRTVYEHLSTRMRVEARETELSGLLALAAALLAVVAAALSLWWFNRTL